jgi:N-acetyl-gamma-glutamyl-phosphate reductase, uncommon form
MHNILEIKEDDMAEYKVFIDGSSGTCGLKIDSYLGTRRDIEVVSTNGVRRRTLNERKRSIENADIAFLCLPDDASMEIVRELSDDCRIIDTSSAHRTEDGWVYGMPELTSSQRDKISRSNRVANPGCHASGFIFLVKPLIEAGLIRPSSHIMATSLTGYSGGGKKMIADYESEERIGEKKSPACYGLSQQHKHLPEMQVMTGIENPPVFMPMVCDYYSGMLVTVPLMPDMFINAGSDDDAGQGTVISDDGIEPEDIRRIYERYYGDEPLVIVNKNTIREGFIYASSMSSHDGIEIMVYGNKERPIVCARYDNLCKGAAGAAVQNMNIMLGIEETKGLDIRQ